MELAQGIPRTLCLEQGGGWLAALWLHHLLEWCEHSGQHWQLECELCIADGSHGELPNRSRLQRYSAEWAPFDGSQRVVVAGVECILGPGSSADLRSTSPPIRSVLQSRLLCSTAVWSTGQYQLAISQGAGLFRQ